MWINKTLKCHRRFTVNEYIYMLLVKQDSKIFYNVEMKKKNFRKLFRNQKWPKIKISFETTNIVTDNKEPWT